MTNQDNGGMSYTEGMNYTEGSEVPKEQSYDKTQKLNEAITIIQLLLPMAERGRLPELKQTDEYILNRVKQFLK